MWGKLAQFIIRFRWILLTVLIVVTGFFAYHASKVKMSYEFSRAIPTDNIKYLEYEQFRKQFGTDGNIVVIGMQTPKIAEAGFFNAYAALEQEFKSIPHVDNVLGIPGAMNLKKNVVSRQLEAERAFPSGPLSQEALDSAFSQFYKLPFYRGLLYSQEGAFLMAINIDRQVLNSKSRDTVIAAIEAAADRFGATHNVELYKSGLPLIRSSLTTRIANEMKWFLAGSFLLSALILFMFFRSLGAVALSLTVVLIGVIWSLGTIQLMGYKITLLTALIPPLVVVIGIPNCIYFLNKYHTAFRETGEKRAALIAMISKMGIVTLFCNVAAAIGFAVFSLTRSEILNEFGAVAGINIMALFFISLVFIPAVLSLLPEPRHRHTRYLDNRWLLKILDRLEHWSLHYKRPIYLVTLLVLIISVIGMFQLRAEGYIVDDLPKTDKIYTDLKFFEKHFRGVMPLEIVVDTKRKNGLRVKPLQTFEKIDSLSAFIAAHPDMARPLSIVEGMKFARQAYYDGDSASYGIPNAFDISFLSGYLSLNNAGSGSMLSKLSSGFMDSNRQQARISINMADVGSKELGLLLDTLQGRSAALFDSSAYSVIYTGSSITFLEGSEFIINGLKESIFWAFLLISLCMLYLFRSGRILLCSLIPNIIPLIITAGVMGWAGVRIKPSTVLIFSVALGIAIDITIRFLVNYKQEMKAGVRQSEALVIDTIHKTGISIIYTSLVLIAGFVIFCFSGFGGTQGLGWLTSLTLVLATLTNLIFLPSMLLTVGKKGFGEPSAERKK